MSSSPYKSDFYENRHQQTVNSARKILSIVESVIPEIRSAVDLGCGVGTWLSVLKERGVNQIRGFDGNWVDKNYLQIPLESFVECDFTQKIDTDDKFDLAISLEVAEHIPENKADNFVDSLTQLSDFVLFSAAIPSQRGIGHINEQWPIYWISLFTKRNYVAIDLIRRKIWQDKSILSWYRSNTLLFVHQDRTKDLKIEGQLEDLVPLEIYCSYYDRLINPPIRLSFIFLLNAITKKFVTLLKQ